MTQSPNQDDVIRELVDRLRSAMALVPSATSREDQIALKGKIGAALNALPATRIAFPPCADVLLSSIVLSKPDEITAIFNQYFVFELDEIVSSADAKAGLDAALLGALKGVWPPGGCLPSPAVTLKGNRHLYLPPIEGANFLKRVMTGDLIWLFYMERMGLFSILGAILDDYATRGKYPVPSDSIDSLILEAMVRQVKSGVSSSVRDRDSSYRRCLGWTSEPGRKLGSPATVNADFNTHFHKVVRLALEYLQGRAPGRHHPRRSGQQPGVDGHPDQHQGHHGPAAAVPRSFHLWPQRRQYPQRDRVGDCGAGHPAEPGAASGHSHQFQGSGQVRARRLRTAGAGPVAHRGRKPALHGAPGRGALRTAHPAGPGGDRPQQSGSSWKPG